MTAGFYHAAEVVFMVKKLALLVLAAIVVSCGSGDHEAPQLVQSYPPDGYHGFRQGEEIVLTFSEPMDAAATEEAFSLTDSAGAPLPVSFTWEDGGRRLRAAPETPLAYSPDDNYLNYRYYLSTGARDRAGNPLANPVEATFSTLRTLTVVRDSVPSLDGAVSSLGFVYNDPNDPTLYTQARTGDTAADIGVRSYFAFDLQGLAFDPADVAFARLNLYNVALYGAPFGSGGLGNLVPEAVSYLENDSLDAADYALDATDALDPVTAWPAGGAIVLELGDWVKESMNAGSRYLQVRLRFEQESDGDGAEDSVNPATGENSDHPPRLEIGYYTP
ncbi:Ig-like domain-containing protein [Oceanithermus sp.]